MGHRTSPAVWQVCAAPWSFRPAPTYDRTDRHSRRPAAPLQRAPAQELHAAGAPVPGLPQAGKTFQRLHRQELRRRLDPVRPVHGRRDRSRALLGVPDGNDLLGARDKAMLEVLYSSGIRVSELVELELSDLDLQEGILRVRGKGRKDRLTPIGSQAIKALQRYFELRNADNKTQT